MISKSPPPSPSALPGTAVIVRTCCDKELKTIVSVFHYWVNLPAKERVESNFNLFSKIIPFFIWLTCSTFTAYPISLIFLLYTSLLNFKILIQEVEYGIDSDIFIFQSTCIIVNSTDGVPRKEVNLFLRTFFEIHRESNVSTTGSPTRIHRVPMVCSTIAEAAHTLVKTN